MTSPYIKTYRLSRHMFHIQAHHFLVANHMVTKSDAAASKNVTSLDIRAVTIHFSHSSIWFMILASSLFNSQNVIFKTLFNFGNHKQCNSMCVSVCIN